MSEATDAVALQRIEFLLDAGRHADAVRALTPVLAQAPSDVAALTLLGRAHAGARDLPKMIEVANALVVADPDGFFGHLLAADALFAKGSHREALTAAQAAVTRAPDMDACHRMVAWAASEVPGEQQLAWEAAGHAVVLDPLDADNHACVGTVAMEQHRHGVAEQAFAEALRLDPQNALARHNLGVLHQRRGKLVDAAENLLSSAALDPQQELVPRNLTGVVLVWLQRTHWGLWALLLLGRSVTAEGAPSSGISWPNVAALAVAVLVGVWWTRRTVLSLGSHARTTMWRVLHRSGFTAGWFWSLVIAALALVVVGVAPNEAIRLPAVAVAGFALIVGCLISWIGVAARRR